MSRPPARELPEKHSAQPGRLRAVVLAVAVHAAFFALIVFGVSWQSSPTPPVQVEVWDKLPPVGKPAPVPKAEPPKPEPPPPEPPKPEPPKPVPPPPKATPPKVDPKPLPPKVDPAIALKAEQEKREKEKRERLEKQREEEKKKREEDKKKRDKDEALKKKEQEDAARKKREDDKRKQDEDKKKQEEEQARVAAEKARAEAAASARQKEFDRYVNGIKAKIRSKANVPDTVRGEPMATFNIRILPGGEVLEVTLTKSSGNPSYDSAIERAIRSASPLPVPEPNSELFPQFRTLNLQIRHER